MTGPSESPLRRVSKVEVSAADTLTGWAEIVLHLDGAERGFGFSLVMGDPLEEIEGFARAVAAGRPARMEVNAEPGRTVITAAPADPDGWVHLCVDTGWPGEPLARVLSVLCPAGPLWRSMFRDIGFLAKKTPPEPGLAP